MKQSAAGGLRWWAHTAGGNTAVGVLTCRVLAQAAHAVPPVFSGVSFGHPFTADVEHSGSTLCSTPRGALQQGRWYHWLKVDNGSSGLCAGDWMSNFHSTQV
jgi:hypothetical protein